MKKVLMMVIAAMMVVMSVNAQVKGDVNYRFRGGITYSTLTNNDDAKYKVGWSLGTGFDFFLTDKFALGLDLTHDVVGANIKSLDENFNLEYIGFGPLAKYYATQWMALYAGPEINFLTSAKVDDESYKSHCKKTELSVPIGISFEPVINKTKNIALIIDLRYRLGLTNVNKESFSWANDVKNSGFIFTFGCRYPAPHRSNHVAVVAVVFIQ